jgi:hypothetical protein
MEPAGAFEIDDGAAVRAGDFERGLPAVADLGGI